MDTWNESLKRLRLEAGRTLADVASAVGFSRQYLFDIERGARRPSMSTCKTLNIELGLSGCGPHLDRVVEEIAEFLNLFPESASLLRAETGWVKTLEDQIAADVAAIHAESEEATA